MNAFNYAAINTEDALKAMVDKLMAEGKPIGFDIETGYHGPDRKKGAVYVDWDEQFPSGFSITNSKKWARYVPTAHEFRRMPNAWEIIKPALETLPVIAHNAKFEKRNLRALDRKGIGPNIEVNIVGDSMLQSYALAVQPKHGLKVLVKELLGHEMASIESLFPDSPQNKLDALRFNVLDADDPEVISYACEDALWCLVLHELQAEMLENAGRRQAIYNMEMGTMELLCDLEDAGHATDWPAMFEQHEHAAPFEEYMTKAARDGLSEMTGQDQSALNLKSSAQMKRVLYGDLGLTTTRLTKKGEPSTDAIALEGLSRDYPAIKKVLEVREVANLKGRLKKWTEDYSITHDKRVHANFNQVIVGSGRFSANDPSIQQLPKDWRWTTLMKAGLNIWEEEKSNHWKEIIEHPGLIHGKHYWGGNFRDFLCAAPGTYLLFFDYSQVELRALAGMSQEPYLIEAFNNGVDIHTATAAMMLGKEIEQVQKKDRAKGKMINFGIVYGMGAKLLAEQLAITKEEAQELLDKYMSAFSRVSGWMASQKAFGKTYGYVETHFGRRVTLWDLQSDNFAIQGKGERLCVNAPVQGTAADIMKISMLRAKKALEDKGWWMTKVRMINNVHDALTFEVDNDIDPRELRELLTPQVSWEIPNFPEIVADWELGQNWGQAKAWKNEDVEFDGEFWRIVKAENLESEVKADPDPTPQNPENWQQPEVHRFTLDTNVMPTRETLNALVGELFAVPGENLLVLGTPQGEVELTNFPTGLDENSAGDLVRILGGPGTTTVRIEKAEIDVAALAASLE